MNRFKEIFKPGIIVSCQAYDGEPMYSEDHSTMWRMAVAAKMGGAVGIRANILDLKSINEHCDLPLLAINKVHYDDCVAEYTNTMKDVDELCALPFVKCIAMEVNDISRHKGELPLEEFVAEVKRKYPNIVIYADCSTYEEAIRAAKWGCDAVSSTDYGYYEGHRHRSLPGIQIVEDLVEALKGTDIPVIAEGGVNSEEHIKKLVQAGAYNVVIGGAITRPQEQAARFCNWFDYYKGRE